MYPRRLLLILLPLCLLIGGCSFAPEVSEPTNPATPTTRPTVLVPDVVLPGVTVPPEETDHTGPKNTDLTFPAGPAGELTDFFGFNHIWNHTCVLAPDALTEGGLRTEQMGCRVLKIYLTNYYDANYTAVSWPQKRYASPAELADSPPYRKLFAMDIDTFVIGTYLFSNEFGHCATYFADQFPEKARELEYRQMYELTYYLCKAYAGTGKTFILQNWESDWSCLPYSEDRGYPDEAVFERLIRWCNTRQDAVTAARRDAGCEGVYVYHALEVNLVVDGIEGHPCVTRDVVPYTYCDYYSYSAYDSQSTDETFAAALDYLLAQVAANRTGGRSRCYIGEFGFSNAVPVAQSCALVDRVFRIAREKGLSYALLWHLTVETADLNTDTGFWLVDPTGEYHPLWNYLYRLLHNGADDPAYLAALEARRSVTVLRWAPETLTQYRSGQIKLVNIPYDGAAGLQEYQGRICAVSDPAADQIYLYFNADDLPLEKVRDLRIRVTVWDEKPFPLSLQYNSTSSIASAQTVMTKGSGGFAEYIFTLRDADFATRLQSMADFRLYANGRNMQVAEIVIEKP